MTTKDEIQTSINSRLESAPTKIEGGTVQDIVGSVSYELANIIDTMIQPVIDNAFVTTADEEHLLIKGGELGINKRSAVNAFVKAQITGATPGVRISTEVRAKTDSNVVFRNVEEKTVSANGSAEILMQCTEAGSIGNISPSELNSFYDTYTGLSRAQITNNNYGYDGYDEEDTEEYRARILEYLKEDAANSNIADYKMWAKSVSGVKNAIVQDSTIAGAGHVKVYISAVNNAVVTQNLINNVKTKIEAEQIINATVQVLALEYVTINVSAAVTLEEGALLETAEEYFNHALEKYLDSCPNTVSYFYILNLFFDEAGILDVSSYSLNGGEQSIQLTSTQIPIKGTVSISLEGA